MLYQSDPVIHVDFVNAATGEIFAYTELPSSKLPESFEVETTMNIGDQAWTVLSAEPSHSRDFKATRHLKLSMQKPTIEMMDPSIVCYSMPTIENSLPGIAADTSIEGKEVFCITEDDWRQIEFVGFRWEFRIEPEMIAIKSIIHEHKHKQGGGYVSLHMRGAIPNPLEGVALTLDEVVHIFGAQTRIFEGVTYRGADGLIHGGFAIITPANIQFYGTHETGGVSALCMHGFGVDTAIENSGLWREVQALSDFMRRKKLCLVDWCAPVKLMPGTPDLFEYFGL